MIVMDTSAAVAILRGEAESEAFRAVIDQADGIGMSAASVMELAIVTAASGPELVDAFLEAMRIRILAVDEEHLRWARVARSRFGRGSDSPARLNFGDCLAYGAAMATGHALLYKGEDFPHTDVRSAMPV